MTTHPSPRSSDNVGNLPAPGRKSPLADFALAIASPDKRDVIAGIEHDISPQQAVLAARLNSSRPSRHCRISDEWAVVGLAPREILRCRRRRRGFFLLELVDASGKPCRLKRLPLLKSRPASLSTFALCSGSSLSTRWESWAKAPLSRGPRGRLDLLLIDAERRPDPWWARWRRSREGGPSVT